MFNSLADLLKKEKEWTHTENGHEVKNTTDNPLLDFFATCGAMRPRQENEILAKFLQAYYFDKLGALRCLFYCRDIRGGLGERRTFQIIYRHLGDKDPEFVVKYLYLVPEMGRFDDFYVLIGTKAEKGMWKYVKQQLDSDIFNMKNDNHQVSLLAKWLKKADSRSEKTKELGIYTAKKLGMSVYDYKRTCNKLRKYIDVVEVKMGEQRWDEIQYSKVPSRASMIYCKAFYKHDQERYEEFIQKVNTGDEKINASTLYPYDIVGKFLTGDYEGEETLQALWDNLPNYVEGENNIMVLADVSSSMSNISIRPLATSIGLAIYFATRNSGAFKNLFMAFSGNTSIVELREGMSIGDMIRTMNTGYWGSDTNLEKAFGLILDVAIRNNMPPEMMPKSLVIVSDMEINAVAGHNRCTYATHLKEMYEQHGYKLPKLVFWNVDSRNDTFLADTQDSNAILVSGQSAGTFKNVLNCLDKTMVDMMYSVLNSERYAVIQL